jgi:predicted nuclease of restriction endonuclease-like RecB superfamily
MMRNLDDLDVIRVDLTEEHQRDFDKIRSLLLVEFYKYIDEIIRIYEDTIDLSDKELGLKLKAGELNKYSKVARGFVFACRKRNFLIDVYKVPESKSKNVRNALFEAFRPVGNVLEGFNESSAEDRFDL